VYVAPAGKNSNSIHINIRYNNSTVGFYLENVLCESEVYHVKMGLEFEDLP
jgi:hypothetical protein